MSIHCLPEASSVFSECSCDGVEPLLEVRQESGICSPRMFGSVSSQLCQRSLAAFGVYEAAGRHKLQSDLSAHFTVSHHLFMSRP